MEEWVGSSSSESACSSSVSPAACAPRRRGGVGATPVVLCRQRVRGPPGAARGEAGDGGVEGLTSRTSAGKF